MGGRFPGKGWGSAAAGCGNSGHRPGCKAGARALRKQGVVCEAAWGCGSPLQGGHGLVGESLEPNHPQLLIDSVLKGETRVPKSDPRVRVEEGPSVHLQQSFRNCARWPHASVPLPRRAAVAAAER